MPASSKPRARAAFKLPKLPPMRTETKVLIGLLGVSVWTAYRVRKGLSLLPFGIGDAIGQFVAASAQGYSDTAAELASRTGAQAPTVLESTGALVSRIAGAEPPPEIITRPDRGAGEGPYLGTPKNLLGVAGKVRSPAYGQQLPTELASDTFPVDAALENQAKEPRTGTLELVVHEESILGTWNEKSVSGGRLTLEPGEFRQVVIRAPNVQPRPFSPQASRVRLRFAGYTLDSVDFRRTYSLL